jgi:predicted phage terminase large subunit-like protein
LSRLLGGSADLQTLRDLRSRALIELARTDGPEAVFAYGELVFGYVPADHQRIMVTETLASIYARSHEVYLLPRGGAKTTWDNTILCSWLVGKFPDLRIGMVSNTDTQAKDFSRAVKYTVQANPLHREVFPDSQPSAEKWTDKEWLVQGSRWLGSKDVTMFAVGVGGAIISKRFDLILMDDILDEENTQSIDQREGVEIWFKKTLKPCLAPDGVVVAIGTRWGEGDLYEQFMTPTADGGFGWKSHVVSALTEDEAGQLVSYWPEYWPVERLLREKEEMGSALFACSYQNDISGLLEGNVFKGPFDHFDVLPPSHAYSLRMGVDLASSVRERADFTARTTTAEDVCQNDCPQKGDFFVLSAYRDKRESHHAEFIHDGWLAFPNIGIVIVESQQFQSTLVQDVMETYPRIPIEGKKADVDKVTRARAVAAKYEAHKVHHHISLRGSAFEIELLSFPKGHDDFVDALGYSMDLGGTDFFYGSLKRSA